MLIFKKVLRSYQINYTLQNFLSYHLFFIFSFSTYTIYTFQTESLQPPGTCISERNWDPRQNSQIVEEQLDASILGVIFYDLEILS